MDCIHPAAFFCFRRASVHLLYLDDSGHAKNPNEEYLVLGGISIFERQIHFVSQELDKIASRLHPSDPSVVEFHASHMYSAKTPPWKGLGKRKSRDVIKEVLRETVAKVPKQLQIRILLCVKQA